MRKFIAGLSVFASVVALAAPAFAATETVRSLRDDVRVPLRDAPAPMPVLPASATAARSLRAARPTARAGKRSGAKGCARSGASDTDGACRDRTGDLRLAKPALSQLS